MGFIKEAPADVTAKLQKRYRCSSIVVLEVAGQPDHYLVLFSEVRGSISGPHAQPHYFQCRLVTRSPLRAVPGSHQLLGHVYAKATHLDDVRQRCRRTIERLLRPWRLSPPQMDELHGVCDAAMQQLHANAEFQFEGLVSPAKGDYQDVVLTGWAPIRIAVREWPLISYVVSVERFDTWDGSSMVEGVQTVRVLAIRRHADQRTLVYAKRYAQVGDKPQPQAGDITAGYLHNHLTAGQSNITESVRQVVREMLCADAGYEATWDQLLRRSVSSQAPVDADELSNSALTSPQMSWG